MIHRSRGSLVVSNNLHLLAAGLDSETAQAVRRAQPLLQSSLGPDSIPVMPQVTLIKFVRERLCKGMASAMPPKPATQSALAAEARTFNASRLASED